MFLDKLLRKGRAPFFKGAGIPECLLQGNALGSVWYRYGPENIEICVPSRLHWRGKVSGDTACKQLDADCVQNPLLALQNMVKRQFSWVTYV